MKNYFSCFNVSGFLFLGLTSFGQFAPPVGVIGTTAIYKDSAVFVAWANAGSVTPGLQDISTPSNGYVNVGNGASAFGIAETTGVVSLGDGGSAILQFNKPIIDGTGPDLAVFENSFDDAFLELAFVEVSSDGINFFRFPATSNTEALTQTGSFGSTDATKINNLAGKYRGAYGTPFDLSDIPNDVLLDKQVITHVKVIDVIGCIQDQYATRDINNNKINDPWPTSFGSGGFDLDAIGVINQQTVGIDELELSQIIIYPNPATELIHVTVGFNSEYSISIANIIGEIVLKKDNNLNRSSVSLNELKQGIYILMITSAGKQKQVKFMKR